MSIIHDLMNDLYDYGFADMDYAVDYEFERISICDNNKPIAHIKESCFDDTHEYDVCFGKDYHFWFKDFFYSIKSNYLHLICDNGYETHYIKIPLLPDLHNVNGERCHVHIDTHEEQLRRIYEQIESDNHD